MLLHDIRHATRLLCSRPGFSLTGAATIALAIAGNTIVFALIRGILLAPLPLADPGRLVRLEERHATGTTNVTGATFTDLGAAATSFDALGAFRVGPAAVSDGTQAIQATAATITHGYFAVLGTRAIAGRVPAAEDFRTGSEPVVFISRGLWERMFGGDPKTIGRSVFVGGTRRTVMGVLDVPASAPGSSDVWLPYPDAGPLMANRRARLLTVIGRLRSDVTPGGVSAELAAIAATIGRQSPDAGSDLSLVASPLGERMVRSVRSSLLVIWAAVGLLLVIAFANVANLLLMEGSLRGRELSLRSALGAPRAALVRQLAIEAAMLGAAGGTAGALFGVWGVSMLRGVLPPSLPRVSDVAADPWLIAFGIGLSVMAAVGFGLVPAWRASRRDAAAALRSRDESSAGSGLREALVAAEVALTVVLLFGAALLGRSLLAASHVPLGFDARDVVTVDLSLPSAKYDGPAAHARFYGDAIARLAADPGFDHVAVTGALPLSPTAATTTIPQDGIPDVDAVPNVITATPELFRALRIPLVRGRSIADGDRAGALPVALVSETAVRTMWPAGVDPIGRTIEMRDWGAPYRATVVGIVGDVRQAGPDQPIRATVYYPLEQFPQTTLTQTIVARTTLPPERAIAAIRSAIRSRDATQPIGTALAMEARIAAALAPRRFNLSLVGAFAATALLLAGVGVYGIVAFALAARTKEIAIRVALGAPPATILRLAARRGAGPIAAGAMAGAGLSWIAAAAMSSVVFGVPARDTVSLAAAMALVVVAGVAALVGPARRALRVDPATSFRSP